MRILLTEPAELCVAGVLRGVLPTAGVQHEDFVGGERATRLLDGVFVVPWRFPINCCKGFRR